MELSEEVISEMAERLSRAARELAPIDPLSRTSPAMTVEDAYRIQLMTIASRRSQGRKVVGKKIGLTSPAMQEMFGVREPDYGHLMDDMVRYEGEPLEMKRLIQPRVEGEIAFVLEHDLKGPGVTPSDVVRATAGVTAALEIIDSRIRNWEIKIQDTVADNASSAALVLGSRWVSLKGLDLRYVGFVMVKNGRLCATSAGAAVLGNPVQAVAWLANKMGEYDIGLKAGEIILSGAAAAAVAVKAGDSVQLTVDRISSVGTLFV